MNNLGCCEQPRLLFNWTEVQRKVSTE